MFQVDRKLISCFTLLISLMAAGLVDGAAQAPAPSPQAAPIPTEPPPSKQLPLAAQQAVGGFWRTDYSFKASIRITNSLAIAPLSVTPVLFMADGTEYPLATVQVPPTSVVTVVINDALASAPAAVLPHLSTYGSAILKYTWRWQSAVSASIVSLDVPRSLTFTSRFVAPSKSSEATQNHTVEGLWWAPFAGSGGFVSLVNTGGSPIEASLQTYDPSGQPLNIASTVVAARATAFLDVRELLGKSPGVQHGGVRVSFAGLSQALVVNGGIEDDNKGFSAALPFEPSMAGMAMGPPLALAHAGLMLGQQDPMMGYPKNIVFKPYAFARNVGSSAVTVTPALNYPSGAQVQSLQLPALVIQPNQTVPLIPPAGLVVSNADHGYVNLVLKTDAPPGSLLTVAGSVDQTGSYVFEIEPQAVSPSEIKQLPYWNTAGANDTMINLWNPLPTPQDLVVSFFAGTTRYRYPVHLEGNGSAMLSVKEIQQTARPDMSGHLLPASAVEGSAWLAGAAGDDQSITVVVSAGTFNILSATCGTTCPNCTGYTAYWIAPDPWAIGSGFDYQGWAYAQLENGTVMNKTSVSTWSSSPTSIASVAGPGLYAGVAAGYFTGSASATLLSSDHQDCMHGTPCPTAPYGDGSAGTVIGLSDSGVNEVKSFATILTPTQIQTNVANWDAAIFAALSTNLNQKASVPTYDFPLYLQVTSECYTNGGTQPAITNNVVRNRTYSLLDYQKNVWPSSTSVTIYENVFQTSGTHTIVGDGSWKLDNKSHITDYLSVGGINYVSPVGAIQQFYAVGSFATSTIPLIILDNVSTKPGTYGTLGDYYQTTGVSINGDHQAGVPLCTP